MTLQPRPMAVLSLIALDKGADRRSLWRLLGLLPDDVWYVWGRSGDRQPAGCSSGCPRLSDEASDADCKDERR